MADSLPGRFFKMVQAAKAVPDEQAHALVAETATSNPVSAEDVDWIAERVHLHRHILDRINLGVLEGMEPVDLAEQIRPIVRQYIQSRDLPLNAAQLSELVAGIADEMLGLGPIEPLLADETVSDILINGHNQVYVERGGRLEMTSIRFKDEEHLLRVINRIVSAVGRRVDETTPMVDARLKDGSRFHVAVRPVAIDGPLVSIRKFTRSPFTLDMLTATGTMPKAMQILLSAAVRGRISIIISGGTGSGKTTMLNALSSQIDHGERLITIEDAAELQLQQPHVGRMETRPPTLDGRNEIRQRELLKNALRMRPDRIIVGEVRGEEAFDMLQAMNTGHEGSMTTIHANSPRDAIGRLEQMVGMAGLPMSQTSIRAQIASAITLIVQMERLNDGRRKAVALSEVTGMDGEAVLVRDIMRFRKTGLDGEGRITGEFRATGIRPGCLETLGDIGIAVPDWVFDADHLLGPEAAAP